MNSLRGIVVVACTLVLGSAAWSQRAGGKLPHPCDLITDEDAEHVFGYGAHLVRSGVVCNIQPEDNKFLTLGVIQVTISRYNWDSVKQLVKYSRHKQVSGLGDDAYISSLGSLLIKKGTTPVTLYIKKGAAHVHVSGWYADFATREEGLRYIGEKLVAGM